MKVWFITVGEPVVTDGDSVRLLRTGILANWMASSGHEVSFWTSTYDHTHKRQRFEKNQTKVADTGVKMHFLHGIGYERNVSVKRIINHLQVGSQFSKLAPAEDRPDVILCSLPTLELSVAAVRFGKDQGVPVVIDIRDLWPAIFRELLPHWLRPLGDLALYPMWRTAREALAGAAAITGNTDGFVNWGLDVAGREKGGLDRSFPFGYSIPKLSSAESTEMALLWKGLGVEKGDGSFVVCFFGTLGRQFDLEPAIDAVITLRSRGLNIKLVICGLGECLESLKRRARGNPAVVFPGWVGKNEIWTLMKISSLGLAPYAGGVGFETNLPNKVIEYLSAGLPLLSSLTGTLEELITSHSCGVTYSRTNPSSLISELTAFQTVEGQDRLQKMSRKAKSLFEAQFQADQVYADMAAYIEAVGATKMST